MIAIYPVGWVPLSCIAMTIVRSVFLRFLQGQSGPDRDEQEIRMSFSVQRQVRIVLLVLAAATSLAPGAGGAVGGPTNFHTLTPCRVFDSRQPADAPALQGGIERIIQVTGECAVPADAESVSLNVTVVDGTTAGEMFLYPGDAATPAAGGMPFPANRTRARIEIVSLASDVSGTVVALADMDAGQSAHLILDINGYFMDSAQAVNDVETVNEDSGATTFDVRANDNGPPSGGPFTIDSVTQPANGTVVITNAGADLTYEPAADYCNNPPGTPTDNFTYTLSPGSSTATVAVTVDCVDDDPAAVDDATTVAEDAAAATVDVLANDTDAESDAFTIASATDPANGTVVIAGDNLSLTYEPDPDYCNDPPGTSLDTFTYTLTPGGDTATVSVTVTCVEGSPVAVDDAATLGEDAPATAIDVLANDSDEESDPFTIASATDPANGTVVLTPVGPGPYTGLTYQPDANYCNAPPGTALDTFTYTLTPGGDTATVSVTVNCDDDGPDAVDDAATVLEDAAATAVDVLANDSDVESDPFFIASVSDPANGTVVLTGGTPGAHTGLTYQPDTNYCGADSFTYTLTPGGDTATVSVTVTCVNGSPVAADDVAIVAEDSGATAVNVLANDTDEESDPFFIASASDPANGTVVLTGGAPGAHTGLTYQPEANYCNDPPGTTPDTFTYTLTPGGDTATVLVTVTCLNDAPVIDLDADDDKGTTGSDFAVTFTEGDAAKLIEDPVDATLTDVDSANIASLTVTLTNLLDAGAEVLDADLTGLPGITKSYDTTTDPSKGVLLLTGPDTLANFQAVLRTVTYRNSDNAPDETARVIELVANDGATDGAAATSTVTLVAVDSNPVAVDDATTVAEDASPTVIDVLANDTDAENDAILIASSSDPANGTVVLTGGTPGAHTGLTYQPDADYCGADSFTYTLTPGADTATVSVTVTCVNDTPVAVDNAATVAEDAAATAIDVLANDTDAESDAFTIASASDPANGTVVLTPVGPGPYSGLTYQPDANYCGADSFTYTLTPGGDSATVSITVTCVNDDPVAVDDAATVAEDSAATAVNVLANDSDPESDSFSIASASDPANGATVVTGGGTGLTYQPDANYCGADSFSYSLAPGGDSATVSVTVTCVDDPPVAVNDSAVVDEDAAATAIDVLSADTDIDGGPKTIVSATDPANGTVVLTGGSPGAHTGLTYQPNANYCNNPPGSTLDTFNYTLNGGSSATVTVTVTCINDAPVLGDATIDYTVLGNTQLRVGETTPGNSVLHIRDNSDVDEKSSPSDVDGPGPLTVVPFSGNSTNGGDVVLNADGTFTYEPAAGFTGTDTFPFSVTDNGSPAATSPGTVSITVSETVWYVHDVTGADNPAASDTGRSTNAFEDLEDVAAVLTDNDYIFVFRGNTGTTPHGGIRINKTGVKLHGEGVGLTVPGFGALIPAGSQPFIDNSADVVAQEDHGVAVDATAASLTGVEIRGLVIEGRDNGIDVTATGGNNVGVTISNNTVTSDAITGLEGVDVNANGTGTVTVTVSNNSLNGRGNAFDARTGAASALRIDFSNNANIFSNASGVVIDGAGGGITTITGFANNSVHPSTLGTGISVTSAIFDGIPGAPFNTIAAGATVVGASGNGVGGSGMVLTNVQGDLSFTDLDVFADGGAGLRASSTAAYTGSAGLRIVLPASVGVVEATGGPAVDITQANVTLPFSSIKSTNSATTGLALNSVAGSFSAGSGSSISNITSAAGTAFQVGSSSAAVTYNGTISTTQGKGVDLTSNTGTIGFTGTLTLSSGSNTAFNATGGGTVTATDTASTLASTTGRALNVSSTTIGASGLRFRSISSNGSINGIVLSSTGSSGGLTVGGNGGSCTVATPTCTGGTIQGSTGAGISLSNTSNVNLSLMRINGGGDDGIRGSSVDTLNLTNVLVTANGNAVGERGIDITQLTGSGSMTNCTVSGSAEHNVNIANSSGVLSAFNVTGSSFTSTNMTTGDDGFLFENNGTGSMVVSITGSTFTDNKGDHFQAASSAGATGSMSVTFSNNTLTTTAANDPNVIGGGITLSPSGSVDLAFTISNNNIQQAFDEAINLNLGTGSTAAASMIGTVSSNTIGTTGDVDSGSESGTGISVISNGAGLTTVAITGNQVRQYANPYGILVNIKEGSTSMNATVTGNTVANPGSFAINGIRVDAGATAGDGGTLCAAISSNSVAGSGPGVDTDIRLRQRFNTTIRLPGYAGGSSDTTAVNSFVAGNNAGSDVSSAHNVGGGGSGFVGGAACPMP